MKAARDAANADRKAQKEERQRRRERNKQERERMLQMEADVEASVRQAREDQRRTDLALQKARRKELVADEAWHALQPATLRLEKLKRQEAAMIKEGVSPPNELSQQLTREEEALRSKSDFYLKTKEEAARAAAAALEMKKAMKMEEKRRQTPYGGQGEILMTPRGGTRQADMA